MRHLQVFKLLHLVEVLFSSVIQQELFPVSISNFICLLLANIDILPVDDSFIKRQLEDLQGDEDSTIEKASFQIIISLFC